ncbi:MAG: DUF551 domain-containing protein [Candidatus Pacebacteria bacterium]|nr:DUF551 domain-containing protein [Candidatus Paceibacterota bacterium]
MLRRANPMTDLNKAGIEKAALEINPLAGSWFAAQEVARAAITAYLEYDRNSSEDAGPSDRGLRTPCGGGAASSAPAPTPETREPSEEAVVRLMSCGVAWRDTAKVIDALRAAYAIDFPSAPKAPSAEGWRPIESAPKDGTEVLVARVNSNGHEIIKAYFDGQFPNYPWFDGSELREHNWPTHWMPLPDPPMKGEKP